MLGWTRALAVDQLTPGDGAIIELRGLPVALFRAGERFHAMSARCPHAGSLISEFLTDAQTAICPSHGWEFRLHDGQCTTMRAQTIRLYPIRIVDGFVYIKVRPWISMIVDLFHWGAQPKEPRRLR